MNSAVFTTLKELHADLRQKGFEPNLYREGDWIDASGRTRARVSEETSPDVEKAYHVQFFPLRPMPD